MESIKEKENIILQLNQSMLNEEIARCMYYFMCLYSSQDYIY